MCGSVDGVLFGYFCCYFFFFKQKTAYELRISDWSSDVCSSDLPVVALLGCLTGLGAMANHRELTAARAAGLSPSRLARPVAGAAGLLIVIAFLAQTYGIPYWERMALRLRAEEIGRASCRERVCKSV